MKSLNLVPFNERKVMYVGHLNRMAKAKPIIDDGLNKSAKAHTSRSPAIKQLLKGGSSSVDPPVKTHTSFHMMLRQRKTFQDDFMHNQQLKAIRMGQMKSVDDALESPAILGKAGVRGTRAKMHEDRRVADENQVGITAYFRSWLGNCGESYYVSLPSGLLENL
jgi:hypothetical protein